jgi:hypothetical protein
MKLYRDPPSPRRSIRSIVLSQIHLRHCTHRYNPDPHKNKPDTSTHEIYLLRSSHRQASNTNTHNQHKQNHDLFPKHKSYNNQNNHRVRIAAVSHAHESKHALSVHYHGHQKPSLMDHTSLPTKIVLLTILMCVKVK